MEGVTDGDKSKNEKGVTSILVKPGYRSEVRTLGNRVSRGKTGESYVKI